MTNGSIRPFYADWAGYNRRTVEGIRGLSSADLALQGPGSDHWPVWALFAHAAGTRVYWLCHVFGEPGAESTPFQDPSGMGWEDDLTVPRTAEELAGAYESTWRIIDRCLERWSPASLGTIARRQGSTGLQIHTRQSILLRLINHEAYHLGEVNLTLGSHGRRTIDPWPSADWLENAPVARREG